MDLLLPFRQMPFGEECSAWERWLLQYGERLSTGVLAPVPSVLSPKLPTPDSPQVSLVHSAFPLLQPRVSGYKQNFVHWPFKWLSESPDIFPWPAEPLLLVTARCYMGSFLVLVLKSGECSLGFRPHTSQGNPLSAEISLWNFSSYL